ncbi:MAG: hypothetical protein AB1585_06355 [Thermodesulfobacteriota bacterium]
MNELGMVLEGVMLPETWFFLAFLFFALFLWIILKRLKGLKETVAALELGHLEFYFQSAEMRQWRFRLLSTERTDMKALQARSEAVLNFFERLGFLVQQGTLPRKEVWQSFGPPISGYFSFLVPFIQWLRMEERTPELFWYFEELNDVVYRLNGKANRKKTRPLMEEEELVRFIEEEKTALTE